MSLTDYSALEQEIDNTPEPTILPRGTEVKARVIAVRTGVSDKNGCTWYSPVFDIPSELCAKEFNDFIWDLADAKTCIEEKQQMSNILRFKAFAQAFGLDYSKPFSWEDDIVGLEGYIILGVKKSDEYGDSNTVSKYVARR
jgi:hypothetical protein